MKYEKKIKVVVKQDEENPMPVEILAQEIKSISDGIKKLRSGRLNENALLLLIQNAAPSFGSKYSKQFVGKPAVKAVLDGITNLEKEYLK